MSAPNPLSRSYNKVTVTEHRFNLEVDHMVEYRRSRKYISRYSTFQLTNEGVRHLQNLGIPTDPDAPSSHSHPTSKTLENYMLRVVIPPLLNGRPWNAMFTKVRKFKQLLTDAPPLTGHQPTLTNYAITPKDLTRYGQCPSPPISSPPSGLLFVHDALHFASPYDVIKMFLSQPGLTEIVASVIVPPGLLMGSPRGSTPLYSYQVRGDFFEYAPDGIWQEHYDQPLSSTWLLKYGLIRSSQLNLQISCLWSMDSVHVISINRRVLPQPHHSYATIPDHVVLSPPTGFFPNQSIAFFPKAMVEFAFQYCLTSKADTPQKVLARLTMWAGEHNCKDTPIADLNRLSHYSLLMAKNSPEFWDNYLPYSRPYHLITRNPISRKLRQQANYLNHLAQAQAFDHYTLPPARTKLHYATLYLNGHHQDTLLTTGKDMPPIPTDYAGALQSLLFRAEDKPKLHHNADQGVSHSDGATHIADYAALKYTAGSPTNKQEAINTFPNTRSLTHKLLGKFLYLLYGAILPNIIRRATPPLKYLMHKVLLLLTRTVKRVPVPSLMVITPTCHIAWLLIQLVPPLFNYIHRALHNRGTAVIRPIIHRIIGTHHRLVQLDLAVHDLIHPRVVTTDYYIDPIKHIYHAEHLTDEEKPILNLQPQPHDAPSEPSDLSLPPSLPPPFKVHPDDKSLPNSVTTTTAMRKGTSIHRSLADNGGNCPLNAAEEFPKGTTLHLHGSDHPPPMYLTCLLAQHSLQAIILADPPNEDPTWENEYTISCGYSTKVTDEGLSIQLPIDNPTIMYDDTQDEITIQQSLDGITNRYREEILPPFLTHRITRSLEGLRTLIEAAHQNGDCYTHHLITPFTELPEDMHCATHGTNIMPIKSKDGFYLTCELATFPAENQSLPVQPEPVVLTNNPPQPGAPTDLTTLPPHLKISKSKGDGLCGAHTVARLNKESVLDVIANMKNWLHDQGFPTRLADEWWSLDMVCSAIKIPFSLYGEIPHDLLRSVSQQHSLYSADSPYGVMFSHNHYDAVVPKVTGGLTNKNVTGGEMLTPSSHDETPHSTNTAPPPPTSTNTCLLDSITHLTLLPREKIWEMMVPILGDKAAHFSARPYPLPLTVLHALSEQMQFGVRLIHPGGITLIGPSPHTNLYFAHGHYSPEALPVLQDRTHHVPPPLGDNGKLSHLSLAQRLILANRNHFGYYTPNAKRGGYLVKAIAGHHMGTYLKNQRTWQDITKTLTDNPPRSTLRPIPVCGRLGVGGSGKTFTIATLLRDDILHNPESETWTIVVGTENLRASLSKDVNNPSGKGYRIKTWEKALSEPLARILILDDVSVLPCSLDLMLLLNPQVELIVFTGDPAQNMFIPPSNCPNREDMVNPMRLLKEFACEYLTTSHRLSATLGAQLGIPATGPLKGTLRHSRFSMAPIITSTPGAVESLRHGGRVAYTSLSSQGSTIHGDVVFQLDNNMINYNNSTFYTALTRSTRNVFLCHANERTQNMQGCISPIGRALVTFMTSSSTTPLRDAISQHIRNSTPTHLQDPLSLPGQAPPPLKDLLHYPMPGWLLE
uniref:Putative RdRp n=1 Tax=Leucocoprinus gammaflexivirus B TaxID=2592758 RepID=A0A7G3W8V1_9VIRU|nr:putative RdRp [Leucocoprinus gammaflexivirus B]